MLWENEKLELSRGRGHYEWNKRKNREEFHIVTNFGPRRVFKFRSWQAAKKAGWKSYKG